MNAEQLIEGISNAVAAAKPVQEYCLFWSDFWWWMCMTKTEWAAWVQAIGVIAALLIPVISVLYNKYSNKKTADKLIKEINHYHGIILREVSCLRNFDEKTPKWLMNDSLNYLSQFRHPSQERLDALAKLDIDLAMNIKGVFLDGISQIKKRQDFYENEDVLIVQFSRILVKDLDIIELELNKISKSLAHFNLKPFWMFI
jgi:hypothetical protein